MSARVEMQTGGAPPEPECFRPTLLQRYGLWIAGWMLTLGFVVILIEIALKYLAHYEGPFAAWPVWYFPFFAGFVADVFLRGPIFPTPRALGDSRLKATWLWLPNLVLFPGALLIRVLSPEEASGLHAVAAIAYMVAIVGFLPYIKLSGWQGYAWPVLQLPPREWAVKRDTAKPGGTDAG